MAGDSYRWFFSYSYSKRIIGVLLTNGPNIGGTASLKRWSTWIDSGVFEYEDEYEHEQEYEQEHEYEEDALAHKISKYP